MVIYIDVLLAVNLYINYFLIRTAALILRRKSTPGRYLLASAAGAVCSLIILVPALHPALCLLIKTAVGALMVLAAFGVGKRIDMLISLLCFLLVSFVLGGAMTVLCEFLEPSGVYMHNGTPYFNIPIIAAAAVTAAVYGGFRLFRMLADRRKPAIHSEVVISRGGASVALDGLADTGNSLRDGFSGKPVIIAALGGIAGIVPCEVLNYLSGSSDRLDGIRLVPCRTVTSEGVIPVFRADISINGKPADALVGVTKNQISGADCIFDPNIIL